MSALAQVKTSHWTDEVIEAYDQRGIPTFMDSTGELIEGMYLNMPNEVYHSLNAQSSSKLKTFAKGRHHYFRQYLSDVCRKRTKQQEYTFDAGTYGHMLVLEEHNFHGKFMRNPVPDDFPIFGLIESIDELKSALGERALAVSGSKAVLIERLWSHDNTLAIFEKLREDTIQTFLSSLYSDIVRTEHDIIQLAKFHNLNTDREFELVKSDLLVLIPHLQIFDELVKKHVIDHVVWDDAFRVQKSTRAHPKANWLFSDGFPELSIIAKCPTTGMMLKVRFDWLRFDAIAVDLKTTASSHPQKFGYQVRELRYDIQQVFYTYVAKLAGIPVRHFTFVATEYKDADNTEIFELSDRKVIEVNDELHELMADLKECFDTEDWYGFDRARSTWVLDI